jgi:spore germination cell wall hydrolase CwlJ-like protein
LSFTVAAITCALLLFITVGQALAAVHTVSKGESLFLIGKWYGTSVEALKSANNLTGDEIRPGQRLTIPSNNTYTVRAGDTLFLIARQHGTTHQALMAANGLSSSAIYPGQMLRLPASNPAPVSRGGAIGNVSAADADLLARIITAEADNQSYQTQVAVGAVVLNRVKSPLFPNTIRGVIYQVDSGGRYQFEPVKNGWINRPASDSARRAAAEALSGADPTNGALFFWESWVRNSYLNSRPVSTVMGAFTFTY